MKRAFMIGTILVLCLAFLLVFRRRSDRPAGAPPPSGSLHLAYPLRQGGWLMVDRAAADLPDAREDRVRRIVWELTMPDPNPAVFPPLPETFPLRSVFVDGTLLYIDMSNEALAGLSGGSYEEMILLESLQKSLASNLPDVDRFQILVDGVPRKSLGAAGEDAGHIAVLQSIPLKYK